MIRSRFLEGLLSVALAAGAALSAAAANAPPAAPAPATATLADLEWIVGDWREGDDRSFSQEHWLPAAGDAMVGTWRMVRDGKIKVVELLAITQEESGPVFRLRHFDRGLVAWEEKDEPYVAPLVERAEGRAVFASQGDDPLRLTYEREGDGLRVLVEHGTERHDFRFRRRR